jgi:hypothetical protein
MVNNQNKMKAKRRQMGKGKMRASRRRGPAEEGESRLELRVAHDVNDWPRDFFR